MITAAKLSQRITIETRAATKDALGGQSTAWSPLGTYWASIRQLSGRALEAAQALQSEVTHDIRIRYNADVTAAHRIQYCGRVFEIKAVWNVDEANVETRILAAEGLSQG